MTGQELSLLIGAVFTVLSGVVTGLVWAGRKLIELGGILAAIEKQSTETSRQVVNSHATLLRDDLTEVLDNQKHIVEEMQRLDRLIVKGFAEHKYIWRAIARKNRGR